MFRHRQISGVEVGDMVLEQVSREPYEIVEELQLNGISHVRLRYCGNRSSSSIKTLAKSMLHLSFLKVGHTN
ncbi:MAG: hypothetical protein CMM73_06110 [Rhodospirillaceae bacterium]|nr:hypothetical protein [Rhodospirillaceae bacterium]